MDYRLDEKGKYYTKRVSKRSARVELFAQGLLISGTMHLLLDNRVKDELNSGERFIAITRAQVRDPRTGAVLAEGKTLILNKDQIVWLAPDEDTYESTVPGHGGSDR
jgi:Family of unknown function (DUF6812)